MSDQTRLGDHTTPPPVLYVKDVSGLHVLSVEGREAGVASPDWRVFTTVRTPFHYMRKFRGFGMSRIVFKELGARGCEVVRIKFEGNGLYRLYECPLSYFINSTSRHTFLKNDVQHFVPVDLMKLMSNHPTS